MNHGTTTPATGLTPEQNDVVTFFDQLVPEVRDRNNAGAAYQAAKDCLNGMSLVRACQIMAHLIDTSEAAWAYAPHAVKHYQHLIDNPVMPRIPRRRLADHVPSAAASAA